MSESAAWTLLIITITTGVFYREFVFAKTPLLSPPPSFLAGHGRIWPGPERTMSRSPGTPTAEQDAGYMVYWGTASGVYDQQAEANRPDLAEDPAFDRRRATYYIAVTAYNQDGMESDYSDEISYTSFRRLARLPPLPQPLLLPQPQLQYRLRLQPQRRLPPPLQSLNSHAHCHTDSNSHCDPPPSKTDPTANRPETEPNAERQG